ncbi:MAG TPA: DUF2203 domain-containing protein [Gemmatimonadaceae bacterium]|nr:DUF2203 domain-containing protein [Gemmatimonadaceae bacterium]
MKQFTVEQANATLPLVRKIVEDIVRQYRVWNEKLNEIDLVAASGRAGDAEIADRLANEAQSLAREIEGFRRELADLGIQIKDPGIGLVDFPSTMGNRPVFLCWRLGEPDVGFWHEVNAGYTGRQPLVPESVG